MLSGWAPLPEAEPAVNPRREAAWPISLGNRHHCGCMWLAQTKRGQVSLNKNLLWLKIKCPVLSCLQTLHNLVPAYLPRLTLRSASPCPPHSSPANSPFPTLPPPGCHGHHHLQWISLLSVKVKSYLTLCLTELGPPWGSLPGLNKPLREGALSYAPSPPCASFWCPLHTAKYLTSLFPVNAPTTHFLRAGTECFLHHCSPRARHRAFRCVCWLQMNMCKAALVSLYSPIKNHPFSLLSTTLRRNTTPFPTFLSLQRCSALPWLPYLRPSCERPTPVKIHHTL